MPMPPADDPRPATSGRVRRPPRRSAQETQDRRRRVLTWALSIALGILLVNALVGENGYLATVRIERDEAALAARVAHLRLENQQLQDARRRLASDPSALDETARRELNFLKPGETLVIIHDAATPGGAPGK